MTQNKKKILAMILPVLAVGSVFYSFNSLQGEDEEIETALEAEEEGIPGETGDVESYGTEPYRTESYETEPLCTEQGELDPRQGVRSGPEPATGLSERIDALLERLNARNTAVARLEEEGSISDDAPEPAPADPLPEENGSIISTPPVEPRPAHPTPMKLRAVLKSGGNSLALIGGYLRREGELLPGGYEVVRIDRKSVHLFRELDEEGLTLFLEPLHGSSTEEKPAENRIQNNN